MTKLTKQEVIENIRGLQKDLYESRIHSPIERHGMSNAYGMALQYIELIEEPEPVELPEFVVEWYKELIIEKEIDGNDMFRIVKGILDYEEYQNTDLVNSHWSITDYGITESVFKWVEEHEKELFVLLATGNYKVRKEPKWIVKLGEMYFIKGTSNLVFTFDKNEARKYHSKTDAEYVMSLFGGTVEEVESE